MTVLIAEDDRDIREILADLLRDEGYTVVTASDGVEAIESIERSRPDVVVLDLWMPRMDGGEVLAELRDCSNPPPVLVLSASLSRAADLVAAAKLAKPFDVEDLLEALSAITQGVDGQRPSPR